MPTHTELFGVKGKTESQIIDGLKEFSSFTILHMCTKLMLFLNSEGALNPKKQTELAVSILNMETRKRLANFIRKQSDPEVAFFHHMPVMMMVKLNLEHNDTAGLEINNEETRTKFVSLLVSLCDIWMMNDKIGGNLKDPRQRKRFWENFRAYQARQFLQENATEPMLNMLARGRYLVDKARSDSRINFDEIFEKATGIKLEVYLDILLMVTAQWSINVDITKLDDISVRSTNKFFEHTKLDSKTIEKFLDVVGFKMDEYKQLNEDLLKRIGMAGDKTLVNFITFMVKPILRYEDKFLCLSPNFLLLQLTDGPYNIVREAIKGTKLERKLPEIWGDAYEEYALERLNSAFEKRVHPKILDKQKSESIDALIDLGDVVLLSEIKYPHWSFKARITGSRNDMHGFMEKVARYKPFKEKLGQPKIDKKKGLGQIKLFIEKVQSNDIVLPVDLKNKLLVPVLVLGEEYPCDPLNRELLEGWASSEGCLLKPDKQTMPFIVLTSEDIELIESLVEELGLDETKKLIMAYVVKFHPDHRNAAYAKRPTSFKNEIFNRKIKVANNKFMKKQLAAAFNPVRKYFKHPKTTEAEWRGLS